MLPNRRHFLLAAAATAATAGLVWSDRRSRALAQEAPPETTKVTARQKRRASASCRNMSSTNCSRPRASRRSTMSSQVIPVR